MATNETRANKGIGSHDALASLDRPQTLGTDTTGAVHHYSAYDRRVVVVAADWSIEQTIDTTDRKLATYVAYVADRRGWDRLHYAETFGDVLKEAISA